MVGARGDISVRWIGSGAGRAGRCCSRGTVRRARTSISLRESCKPCGWNCGWRRAMSGSDHAPRAGRIKLEMKIRRGKAVGVEGSGRGSTTYQAAAAAFVYDDHHGDVRVRRVIVVGLALVASLGFGQAEKRAHEPTHVAAGLATSTKFREKNRELQGCPAPGVDSNVRVEAVEAALGTREVLKRARTPLSCVEPRAVACSPLNGADRPRRGFVFGAPSRRLFGASQNLHDLRASGFSKPQIDPLLCEDMLWPGCFLSNSFHLSYEQTHINALSPEKSSTRFNEIGTDSIVRARSA